MLSCKSRSEHRRDSSTLRSPRIWLRDVVCVEKVGTAYIERKVVEQLKRGDMQDLGTESTVTCMFRAIGIFLVMSRLE